MVLSFIWKLMDSVFQEQMLYKSMQIKEFFTDLKIKVYQAENKTIS